MTPVEFHFVTPAGLAVANTQVDIQLVKSGFDAEESGVLMPRLVTALTDAQGKVTVPLRPSPTMYVVSMLDPVSEAGLSFKFYVPEVTEGLTVRLQDIVVEGPMSDTEWDTVAIQQILDAKASALAAKIAAEAAQVIAQTASSAATASAAAGAASATGAAGSATSAGASATTATASEAVAVAKAAAALASQTAAASSATAAASSAGAALASENTATARAAAALASQNSAATSEANTTALTPVFSATPPVAPVANATWINSETGRRYTYLFDGTSSQWVETGAVVVIGSDTIAAAEAAAAAAALSADEAEESAALSGITSAAVNGSFELVLTRGDGSPLNAGYVRGPQGAAFTVDAIGANLAARDAYDSQPDEFSFLDTGAGNLYFRQGATPGVWSTAIPFGKGETGDPGTTDFNELINKPVLGTASPLNIAASGNASASEVVKGNDTRLSDARTPVTHTHPISQISDATATGAALLSAASAAAARSTLVLDQVNNTSDAAKPVSDATQTALDAKATASSLATHTGSTTNPHAVTKAQVGLSNVDNLSVASILESAALTGIPTAPTAAAGTATTQIASTAFATAGDVWERLADVVPGDVNAIELTLPTTHRLFRVHFVGIRASAGNASNNLYFRVFQNGAILVGAIDYFDFSVDWHSAAGTVNHATVSHYQLTRGGNNATPEDVTGWLEISPGAVGVRSQFTGMTRHLNNGASRALQLSAGEVLGETTRLEKILLAWVGGTNFVSGRGRVILLGLRP